MIVSLRHVSLLGLLLLVACGKGNQPLDERERVEQREIQSFQIGITNELSRIPWTIVKRSQALKAIEQRHGIRLELINFANEADAVLAYSTNQIDAVTSTLNTLVGTIEKEARATSVILLTDFSQGTYGLLSKAVDRVEDLASERIHVELNTASHYYLFRVLENAGLELSDINLIGSSASKILQGAVDGSVTTFAAGTSQIGRLRALPEFQQLMTRGVLAGEMLGGLAVDRQALSENPGLGEALIEVWFEAVANIVHEDGKLNQAGISQISKLSGLSEAIVEDMLRPANLITDPERSLSLLEAETLDRMISGGQRFRLAAEGQNPIESDLMTCVFSCAGDMIENSAGTRLFLDKQYVEQFIKNRQDVE